MAVRLVVDDLRAFRAIDPRLDVSNGWQDVDGITVMCWAQALNISPGDLVIEAFAVNLPTAYVDDMATKVSQPVWLNLEYLSAESWVGTHHLLPSPHPNLLLTKYFFFPGFTPDTGGLIRERDLLNARDSFISANVTNCFRVFLFGYPNAASDNLINAIIESGTGVQCTVPDGALAETLKKNPAVTTIQFAPQQDFDRLLWQHDVLFVRGEDSFVRAQWAGMPFIWQIYPQSENTHLVKLNAFLALYCEEIEHEAAAALRELWRAWNAEDSIHIAAAWRQFMAHLPAMRAHAKAWSRKLAEMPDLAANLLSFYQKTTKI